MRRLNAHDSPGWGHEATAGPGTPARFAPAARYGSPVARVARNVPGPPTIAPLWRRHAGPPGGRRGPAWLLRMGRRGRGIDTETEKQETRAMHTRQLGASDLHITPVGFGAWAIGGPGWAFAWGAQDDRDSIDA